MRDRLRLAAVSEMERRRGEFIGVQLHSKVSIFSHPSGGYGTHMYAIAAVPPLTYLCRRFKEGGREGGSLAWANREAAAPVRVRPLSELYCPQ